MNLEQSILQFMHGEHRGQPRTEKAIDISHRLNSCLKKVEITVSSESSLLDPDLKKIALGLFCKLRTHYLPFVLVTLCGDETGSTFLTENLYETAIALVYLLEEADEALIQEYIEAGSIEAKHLLHETERELERFPDHQNLLKLRDELKARMEESDWHEAKGNSPSQPQIGLSDRRAEQLGLRACIDPSRKVILDVEPGSWLDLKLNFLGDRPEESRSLKSLPINYMRLRDISHLCIHSSRTILEEALPQEQEIDSLRKELGQLFILFREIASPNAQ